MTSRLSDAASPYLRAHADNPVAWFPWGPEAFRAAAERDVPVLVSIGYSTCHWCHVMARESFADPATAAQINDGFVAVKVDREEHPDVDAAYLAAASAFTPNLGWPLTVFTTAEGRAFYAGTYWPTEPRGGHPSFRQVLAAVCEAWTQRRGEVEGIASDLHDALARVTAEASDLPDADALARAAARIAAVEDPEFGGFGSSGPKFPSVPVLRFLQSPALRGAGEDIVARALNAMAGSELHDAVEGGYFRYATARDWSTPHYEKMLTDNAGLIDVALDAGRADIVRDIAHYLRDVLLQPSGAFAAAQDSESWIDGERSEGGYYLRGAEGRALLEAPAVDQKVVTGWNGMAIGALARAGVRMGDRELIRMAAGAADAVRETNVDARSGRYLRASLDEIGSRALAVREDYGLLADGLLALALATGDPVTAIAARDAVDEALAGLPQDPVLADQGVVVPAGGDTDHPSGDSALASACLTLWMLGAGERYREASAELVAAAAQRAVTEPLAHGAMLRVAAGLLAPPRQLVVVVADPEALDSPLVAKARATRADVLAIVSPARAAALADAGFSLFEGKVLREGVATAYDCRDFVCRLPVSDAAE